MSAYRKATPQQIVQIRHDWDEGVLDVRGWADALDCSLETIRRIARRDTNRGMRTGQAIEGAHQRGGVGALDEPSDEEIAASLVRLQQAMGSAPVTGKGVDKLLDELGERDVP